VSSPLDDDELRQGDWLVGLTNVPVVDAAGDGLQTVETPHGVTVLTQCCDLAHDPAGLVHGSAARIGDT
jgi:hypothetical protein